MKGVMKHIGYAGHTLKMMAIVLFIVGLAGCAARGAYQYGLKAYDSPEEALAAKEANLEKLADMIPPTDSPQGGEAVFIVPTLETCTASIATGRGNAQQEQLDYHGKTVYYEMLKMGVFLERRKIFKSVTIIEEKFPVPAAMQVMKGYDAVIYLDMAPGERQSFLRRAFSFQSETPGGVSTMQMQWFLRAAPEYNDVPINFNRLKAAGVPIVISWLDDIEDQLKQSGYQPRNN